jgi:hypothetical protein
VHVLNTYASGPWSQVNSIIWPNPEFDNDITVYGPEVKALAGRYLIQMIEELGQEPGPDGGTLLEDVELIVPHQANKTMILQLAAKAGVAAEQLYFNIETMGNVSSASIPVAIADCRARQGDHRAHPGLRARASGRARWAATRCSPSTRRSSRPRWSSRARPRTSATTAPTTSADIAAAFGD